MNKYYVYEHSLDGRIFYVGHGCGNRAWNVKSRSNRYKNYIKERYDDIEVTIVQDNLTKEAKRTRKNVGWSKEHQENYYKSIERQRQQKQIV